jgi:hypothetical protein
LVHHFHFDRANMSNNNSDSLFGLSPEEELFPRQRNHIRKRKKRKNPSLQRFVEFGLLLDEMALILFLSSPL